MRWWWQKAPAQPATATQLQLVVRTPQNVLFTGEVTAVTSQNQRGTFDILPQHTQFVSLITDNVIARRPTGDKTIPVPAGILKVKDNLVEVFVTTGAEK
jgi:F0F1-type ATP synthase epsilon subunit